MRATCRFLALAPAVMATLLMSGCATDSNLLPADSCPAPQLASAEYVIGSGDTLGIVIWRNEELSTTVPVRPDGRISTPLVDDLQAAGKTPSQLASDIEALMSEYLRTPEVSVIVREQGAANQIQVIGEVNRPQALAYRKDIKALDVVVGVGGLTDFAAGNRARLVRNVDGRQVECQIRVSDLLAGDMSQNLPLFPGDVIVIPETRF